MDTYDWHLIQQIVCILGVNPKKKKINSTNCIEYIWQTNLEHEDWI